MENTDTKNLSFPQRNWFLMCILVAILSPLVVHWVTAGARAETYHQSEVTRPPSVGGVGGTDTSYSVATAPANPTTRPNDTSNNSKPNGAARPSLQPGKTDSSKN